MKSKIEIYVGLKVREFRLKKDWTQQYLADVLNLSPEHFCRLFHSITGKSPIDYLNYYRIECACELLSSSQKSITEVAYSCGFNDLSYFNRIFKRYKKVTPGHYQKTMLSKKTE